MRFMQVHNFYDAYLDDLYRNRPGLAEKGFQEQTDAVLADGFASSHLFAPYLAAHGFDSRLVIANNRFAQASWLKEQGKRQSEGTNWLYDVVRQQICDYRPDVLYLTDPIAFDRRFIDWLPFKPALVLGWRAAEIPQGTDWTGFDLIISNHGATLEQARALGAKQSRFFMPGFPTWVARELAEEGKRFDVVFSGQVSGQHARRAQILAELGKLPLQERRPVSLAYFIGNMACANLPAAIAMYDRGAVWGMDMFRATAQGRIVLNAHIDLANGQSGNMRVFETTGTGSFLLTDHTDDLARYFKPGHEVESYRSQGELHEKILYYLDHEAEREEIARRGQKRCLEEYSMERRAEELAALLHETLGTAAPVRPVEDAAMLKAQAERDLAEGKVANAFDVLIRAKALKTPLKGLDLMRAHCFIAMGQMMAAKQALLEELRYFPDNDKARELLDRFEAVDSSAAEQFRFDQEFNQLLAAIRPYSMMGEHRLYSLFQLAKYVCQNDIPGNFVECGVAAGGSSALLAYTIKKYSTRPRTLFSFDSFSGMPTPGEHDVEVHGGMGAEESGWGTGTCAAPVDSLLEIAGKLGVVSVVKPVKGYYEDTLPRIRSLVGEIAFIHIDSDWYESTRVILDNLYDQVHPQALVQFDDYGYWKGCGKALHEFEKERGVSFAINDIDGCGVWFRKPAAQ